MIVVIHIKIVILNREGISRRMKIIGIAAHGNLFRLMELVNTKWCPLSHLAQDIDYIGHVIDPMCDSQHLPRSVYIASGQIKDDAAKVSALIGPEFSTQLCDIIIYGVDDQFKWGGRYKKLTYKPEEGDNVGDLLNIQMQEEAVDNLYFIVRPE